MKTIEAVQPFRYAQVERVPGEPAFEVEDKHALALKMTEDPSRIIEDAFANNKLPTGGEMKYVEHGGKAIDAGRVSLQDLEQQMIQAGNMGSYSEKK